MKIDKYIYKDESFDQQIYYEYDFDSLNDF